MNQMGFAELFLSAQGRAPRLPSLLAAAYAGLADDEGAR